MKLKEFETDITPFFDKGLRADFRNKRNSPALLGCNNLKPTAWGLSPVEPVVVPISNEVLSSWSLLLQWPYPRLHRGHKNTFLTSPERLFYVNEGDWSLQQMDIYSYATPTDLVTPEVGGLWQLVDFYDTFLFTNGRGCVFHFNLRNALGQSTPEKVFYSSALRATAGADFKGRAVLAGFSPDRTWNSKLSSIFALGAKSAESGVNFTNLFQGFQDNFVMWSTIGGGDLLFWFDENASFNFNEVGLIQDGSSGYNSSRPFLLDMIKRNELGWMPLEWPGMIRALKPLGNDLIAYGDGGVSALFSNATFGTLGQRKIGLVGILSEGAVAGDEAEHVYMDKSGTLWSLESEKLPVRLGYKEWFQEFIQSEVVISFNPDQREWYVSNGWKTFVLTKQGLGRSNQIVTSTVYHDGQVLGLGTPEAEVEKQASVVTDVFDFGNSLIKTITSIEFSFTAQFNNVQVAIDYRYSRNQDFQRTLFKSVPEFAQRGFVAFPVAGIEFRLVMKWADFEQVEPPDQVVVKWKQTDKTNLRSRNAGSVAA